MKDGDRVKLSDVGVDPARLKQVREHLELPPTQEVVDWESGEVDPYWDEVEDLMENTYRYPYIGLFMPVLPLESSNPDIDIRTINKQYGPHVRAEVIELLGFQEDIKELVLDAGLSPALPPPEIGVGLGLEELREKLEESGIWVVIRPPDPRSPELSSVAIWDDTAPVIVLFSGDVAVLNEGAGFILQNKSGVICRGTIANEAPTPIFSQGLGRLMEGGIGESYDWKDYFRLKNKWG